MLAYGVDMLDKDSVLVLVRDVTPSDVDASVIPPTVPSHTRVECKIAGYLSYCFLSALSLSPLRPPPLQIF